MQNNLPAPSYPISSVDNALRLLLLYRERRLIRVTDAAEALGVGRSTAHRLLAMLQHHGFVEQDPETRAYRAGPARPRSGWPRSARTASASTCGRSWSACATRSTRRCSSSSCRAPTGCSSRPSSPIGRCGPRRGSASSCRRTASPAARRCSPSSARPAPSPLPDARDPAETPRSIRSRDALERHLAEVRERGYATNFGESLEEIGTIAVAVHDSGGRPRAGLASPAALARQRVARGRCRGHRRRAPADGRGRQHVARVSERLALRAMALADTFSPDRRVAARRLDQPRARPADRRREALRRRSDVPRHLQRPALLQARLALEAPRRPSLRPRRRGPVCHGALKLLDDAGIEGELALREMRSGRVDDADVGPAAVLPRRVQAHPSAVDGPRARARARPVVRLEGPGMLGAGGHDVALAGSPEAVAARSPTRTSSSSTSRRTPPRASRCSTGSKASGDVGQTRTLAFYSHVDADVRTRGSRRLRPRRAALADGARRLGARRPPRRVATPRGVADPVTSHRLAPAPLAVALTLAIVATAAAATIRGDAATTRSPAPPVPIASSGSPALTRCAASAAATSSPVARQPTGSAAAAGPTASTAASATTRSSGGPGADRLRGGPGIDPLRPRRRRPPRRRHRQRPLNGSAGDDRLFGSTAPTVAGGDGADRAEGGGGNDRIEGNAGDDALSGGRRPRPGVRRRRRRRLAAAARRTTGSTAATATTRWPPTPANDRVIGGAGNDTLNGGDDEDRIDGGDGDDRIDGGMGATAARRRRQRLHRRARVGRGRAHGGRPGDDYVFTPAARTA